MSDDGTLAVVVIALVGNPFSPRYARARRDAGDVSPLDFCALNVAVYGPRGKLWTLRERRIARGDRDARSVAIGRSRVGWSGDVLVADIDELTTPLGRPLRGRVTFRPSYAPRTAMPLDVAGRHLWWPVAPAGRVEVELTDPDLHFSGHGYHDANAGDAPLEASFARWTWSRSRVDDHHTLLAYDVVLRGGEQRSIALDADGRRGAVAPVSGASTHRLPPTAWRLEREARGHGRLAPKVLRELEDTPFYARALLETETEGRRAIAMHETLSLTRLASRWVQFLLPFRMGRG